MSATTDAVRILYYLGYPHRMAGSQRQLLELVRRLPERYEARVVVPRPGEVADAFEAAGVDVRVLSPGPRIGAAYGRSILKWSAWKLSRVLIREYVPYLRTLRELLRHEGIDLVHANDPRAVLLVGPAARSVGLPVVSHLQGEKPFQGLAWRLYEKIPTAFVINARALRHSLHSRLHPRVTTVYPGITAVPPEGDRVPWLDWLRRHGVRVVLCVASVVPFKGYHHLVEAAALLRNRGWENNVAFVFLGDFPLGYDEYRLWLREKIEERGLKNITFTDWQTDPGRFYRSADVVVLPSVSEEILEIGERSVKVRGNEGFPTTHLEAMSLGLPTIGTTIAGVPEQIVDGVTGLLVPPGDPDELANALERLLADSELRARMGQAGLARIERLFTPDAYLDRMTDVYRSLLEAS